MDNGSVVEMSEPESTIAGTLTHSATEGGIPLSFGALDNGPGFVAKLKAGSCFEPGTHSNSWVVIEIVQGTGQFWRGENSYSYEPGMRILVVPGQLHGFVQVREDTLFTKKPVFVTIVVPVHIF